MARWVHNYITKNAKEWEDEKMRRMEERRKNIEEWERKSRLEKIKTLKEKFKRPEKEIIREDEEMASLTENIERNWLEWRRNHDDENEINEKEKDSSARGVQDRKDTLPTESPEDEEGIMVLAKEETYPNGKDMEDIWKE